METALLGSDAICSAGCWLRTTSLGKAGLALWGFSERPAAETWAAAAADGCGGCNGGCGGGAAAAAAATGVLSTGAAAVGWLLSTVLAITYKQHSYKY